MPENDQLEDLTLRQLRLVAQRYRVSRYSRMTKQELIESILSAQTQQPEGRPRNLGKEDVEKAKYQASGTDLSDLVDLDRDLGELPAGYGESRIVMLPRDPQWAYAYWDIPNEHKDELRAMGGQQLTLRLHDVTNLVFTGNNAHTMIEFPCDELAREWYVPIPVSDRDFTVEIGYTMAGGGWLLLARSAPVRVPPMYPSDWVSDYFVSIPFFQDLQGQSFAPTPPVVAGAPALGVGPAAAVAPAGSAEFTAAPSMAAGVETTVHDTVYTYVAQGISPAGSAFEEGFTFPGMASGSGLGFAGLALPGAAAAVGLPPLPALSLFSGLFSGQYYSAQYGEAAAARERGFWLVADAELIIYGATEPDATVTFAGETIKLNPDGTFRFHYHFSDGLRETPIVAVAADGEQTRAISMRFMRQTPLRNTNSKAEMVVAPY